MLRTVGLRVVGFGAVTVIMVLGRTLAADPGTDPAAVPVERVVDPPPLWSPADAAAYPGCVALSGWPSGRPATTLVVQSVREDGHRRIAFDRAWRLNHDRTEADDVWVLGVCR